VSTTKNTSEETIVTTVATHRARRIRRDALIFISLRSSKSYTIRKCGWIVVRMTEPLYGGGTGVRTQNTARRRGWLDLAMIAFGTTLAPPQVDERTRA
jgi:hypothetical protein